MITKKIEMTCSRCGHPGKAHDYVQHVLDACTEFTAEDVSTDYLIEALQEARTQIALLQSMRGIVDTGHGTLSIIDAALAKAEGTVSRAETAEEVTP